MCQGRQLETLRFQANQQVDVVEVPGTGVVLRQVKEGLELLREDLLDRIGIDGDSPVLKQERVGVADGFRMDGVSRGEVELHIRPQRAQLCLDVRAEAGIVVLLPDLLDPGHREGDPFRRGCGKHVR